MSGYGQALTIRSRAADPDNSTAALQAEFSCLSLISQSSCQNYEKSDLHLNVSSTEQYFPPRFLEPYQVYQFTLSVFDAASGRKGKDTV